MGIKAIDYTAGATGAWVVQTTTKKYKTHFSGVGRPFLLCMVAWSAKRGKGFSWLGLGNGDAVLGVFNLCQSAHAQNASLLLCLLPFCFPLGLFMLSSLRWLRLRVGSSLALVHIRSRKCSLFFCPYYGIAVVSPRSCRLHL